MNTNQHESKGPSRFVRFSKFGVARASSPASSGGVPPQNPANGETPSELAAGTATLQTQSANRCVCLALASFVSISVYSWLPFIVPAKNASIDHDCLTKLHE